MNLTLADVLPNAVFLAERRRMEAEVLSAKSVRRFLVEPAFSFLFENRTTCLWQVQEMCRVEHIVAPGAIQHELDTYNALLPSPHCLSATLLIELDDPAERAVKLRAWLGLANHVRLAFSELPPAPAFFDGTQYDTERLSAVQFVKFPLTAAQVAALGTLGQPVRLEITHPACPSVTPLPLTLRAALVHDLTSP